MGGTAASCVPTSGREESDGSIVSVPMQVKRIVRETREFKPNCNLVIIDFLVRHGHLSPELAGYLDLVRELRAGDCR